MHFYHFRDCFKTGAEPQLLFRETPKIKYDFSKQTENVVSSDDVVDAIIEYIKKNDAAVSEVFEIMDLNSDGRISGPELQSWL